MKYCLIFTLLFFAANAPVKPNGKGDHPNSNTDTERVFPLVVVNNQAASTTADHGEKETPKRDASVWAVGANWALVGVGLLTLLAVWKQARETADATKAMRDSIPHQERAANASKESADALVNAERPWIVANIRKTEHHSPTVWAIGDEIRTPPPKAFEEYNSFDLVIKNLGRTPAEVFAVICLQETSKNGFDGGFDSTAEPDYGEQAKLQYVKFLAPGEDWSCYAILTDGCFTKEELDGFIASKLHLIFRGVIKYRDQFRPKVTHETKFCYTYRRRSEDFSPSGPSHYTGYT